MSRPERSGIVGNRTIHKSAAVPSTRTQAFYGNEVHTQDNTSRPPSRHGGSGTLTDPFTLSLSHTTPTIKRKRSATSVENSAGTNAITDVDTGQPIKAKPPVSFSFVQNRSSAVTSGSSSSARVKKEKERAKATSEYAQLLQAPSVVTPVDIAIARRGMDKGKSKQVENDASRPPTSYHGALAVAEYERMRKELETLKKTVHDGKKQLRKQNKIIEDLRTQVATEKNTRDEQEKALATVSSKLQKNEELLQTIESTFQCQICIELLLKPNLLVPCGHIFCLGCLQQWFRSAPSNDDEDDESDPEAHEEYILHREKKCPCCRATIVQRPVSVYIVKNVVTALRAASVVSPMAAPGEEDADPWKGLFPLDCETSTEDDEDEDGGGWDSSDDDGEQLFEHYSDDLDAAEALAMGLALPHPLMRFYQSASESEDGLYSESDDDDVNEEEDAVSSDGSGAEIPYSPARWAPPSRPRAVDSSTASALRKMLQRGCTPVLVELFDMHYTHDEGLVAHVLSLDATEDDVAVGNNRLFLGWNIELQPSEEDGEAERAFIAHQLRDIRRHPERWNVTERDGFYGHYVYEARRLSPEDAEMCDSSDSDYR
ncbi:hypothetical protein GGX14DRAFT_411083 [Mycena pura]|uniref:RING-type domain-containing protein n=1 Tax=Mycena pura TaxID=153505 RepID=A0AAD6YVZ5_9AGAR|nr:hypothetical protein GGX14DRAFT_411083 [Mycena pura]